VSSPISPRPAAGPVTVDEAAAITPRSSSTPPLSSVLPQRASIRPCWNSSTSARVEHGRPAAGGPPAALRSAEGLRSARGDRGLVVPAVERVEVAAGGDARLMLHRGREPAPGEQAAQRGPRLLELALLHALQLARIFHRFEAREPPSLEEIAEGRL